MIEQTLRVAQRTHRTLERPALPGYAVEELLGVGATGEVWAAVRRSDGARVAVKVPARWGAGAGVGAGAGDLPDPDPERELAVLRQLHHPRVVRLIDDLVLADGRPAFVLDLLPGGSLARVVRARGHLTAGETSTVLQTVAETLADLHGRDIAHGDLSPGNILFDSAGFPVIADLGLARMGGWPDTVAPGVGGTTGFLDPAVAAGATPGPAADIFGVGALGWFCLTGSPPSIARPRGLLVERCPDVPPELARAIEAALDLDPQLRPSAADLAVLIAGSGPSEPVALAGSSDPLDQLTHRLRSLSGADRRSQAPAESDHRSVRWRHRVLSGASVVCGVVALVAAALAGAAGASGATGAAVASHGSSRPTSVASPAPTPSSTTSTAWPDEVRRLSAARAQAFNSPSPGGPDAAFDLADSAAAKSDEIALARLRAVGAHYRGLHISVGAVRLLSAAGEQAELRVVTTTSAYDVVDSAGRTLQHRSASAPETATLTLVRTPSGWRVSAFA